MNGTIGGKLRYWFHMLGYWIVVGSWFCNRWRKKWFSLCGMRNVNHPRRPKCMVSAALAAWIVLGSWFCNRRRKKWLQSRGVSNALALPWATPRLQPVVWTIFEAPNKTHGDLGSVYECCRIRCRAAWSLGRLPARCFPRWHGILLVFFSAVDELQLLDKKLD